MADKETRSLSHPTVNGEVKKKKSSIEKPYLPNHNFLSFLKRRFCADKKVVDYMSPLTREETFPYLYHEGSLLLVFPYDSNLRKQCFP